MSNFQNSFPNFDPSFVAHGSFTILSFLIVSIFSFSFIEVILLINFLIRSTGNEVGENTLFSQRYHFMKESFGACFSI